jgi:hypothetical protein
MTEHGIVQPWFEWIVGVIYLLVNIERD